MTDGPLQVFVAMVLICSLPLVALTVFMMAALGFVKLIEVMLTSIIEPGLDRVPALSQVFESVRERILGWRSVFVRWRPVPVEEIEESD